MPGTQADESNQPWVTRRPSDKVAPEPQMDSPTPVSQEQLMADIEVLVGHIHTLQEELGRKRGEVEQVNQENRALRTEIMSLKEKAGRLQQSQVAAETQRDHWQEQCTRAFSVHGELLASMKEHEEHNNTLQRTLTSVRQEHKKSLSGIRNERAKNQDMRRKLRQSQILTDRLQIVTRELQTALAHESYLRENAVMERQEGQSQLVDSLRRDLISMEFECQTVISDRDRLHEQVQALERQLGGDPDPVRISPVQPKPSVRKVMHRPRPSDIEFTDILRLPNAVE